MEGIEVSVIILTYFHEQYIERALKSVLDQKADFRYEILISDDASEDKTLQVVEKMRKDQKIPITIHSYETNVGTTQNLFDACVRAKGKYITLLSGDDLYCDNEKISKQKNYLDQYIDCFAVGVSCESVFTDGELTGDISPKSEYRGKDFSQKTFAEGENYPIHGIMFRNQLYDYNVRKIFHLSVEYSKYIEDLSLCLLLFEFGKVHILYDIGYQVTARRETDTNQHNYNTLYKGINNAYMHVDLMVKLQKYFGKRINLSNRLADPSWFIICYSLKHMYFRSLKHLKGVPITCISKGAHNWIQNKFGRMQKR